MRDITLGRDQLAHLLNVARAEDDVEIHEEYTARGVIADDTCLGATAIGWPQIAALMAAATQVLGLQEALDLAERIQTDNTGHGVTVYWPGVTVTDD
ncbi:hypothetical protein [Planotetraspora sp. GP83]|uniref:hypothetical protein n=1 Tax=Planotetraspora sp. GP83 TaxID=3156264 RepID=UPI0035179499